MASLLLFSNINRRSHPGDRPSSLLNPSFVLQGNSTLLKKWHIINKWHYIKTMASSQSELRVGEQGRIVIPIEIRRALSIDIGSTLVARIEKNKLILEKPDAVLQRLQSRFKKIPANVSLADELIAERRADSANE
jgi:bifunctional DNA-binding transcriptional regulator/antitoxin component of YhaV-PrlF toxin-antitoxin module